MKISTILLIVLGLFLIVDSFMIHAVNFDYNKIGLGLFDPFINHWMIGIIFVVIGVLDTMKKGYIKLR